MDTTHLKVWLPFDESATLDRCGNEWTTSGNPTIADKALQLDGSSYLQLSGSLALGGQDFTVNFYENKSGGGQAGATFCIYADENHFMTLNNEGWYINYQRADSMPSGTNYIEFVYVHSEQKVYFFLNGVLTNSRGTNIFSARQNFNVTIGWGEWRTGGGIYAYWGGTIDEFMIFDGVALHTANFTPPTAADYDAITSWAVTVNADIEALIANRDPSSSYWRYENPGSGDYVLYHDNITTENVDFDQSVTGVAFWGGDRNDMAGVPAGCKELWVRLDLFLNAGITGYYNSTSFSFGCTSSNPNSLNLCGYSNLVWVLPEQSGWSLCIGNTMYFTLTPGKINSILLYLRSGKTDGMIQGTVSGHTAFYTGNVNGGGDFSNLFFTSSKVAALYSNIVASNAPLSLEDGWHREPAAVEFNIKAVDLCVRKNGRTYEIPFSTTNNPPVNSVIARVGHKTVYNPLVATTDENASVLKVRCNGEDRALSASFN